MSNVMTFTIQACGDDTWQEQAPSLSAMKAILAERTLADAGYEPSDKGMTYDIYDEDRSEFLGVVKVSS